MGVSVRSRPVHTSESFLRSRELTFVASCLPPPALFLLCGPRLTPISLVSPAALAKLADANAWSAARACGQLRRLLLTFIHASPGPWVAQVFILPKLDLTDGLRARVPCHHTVHLTAHIWSRGSEVQASYPRLSDVAVRSPTQPLSSGSHMAPCMATTPVFSRNHALG